jgi:hypothetical protein
MKLDCLTVGSTRDKAFHPPPLVLLHENQGMSEMGYGKTTTRPRRAAATQTENGRAPGLSLAARRATKATGHIEMCGAKSSNSRAAGPV